MKWPHPQNLLEIKSNLQLEKLSRKLEDCSISTMAPKSVRMHKHEINVHECYSSPRCTSLSPPAVIAQHHDVAELAEATGRKMYVDPSIYASADEAVRDFAKEILPKFLSIRKEIGRGNH